MDLLSGTIGYAFAYLKSYRDMLPLFDSVSEFLPTNHLSRPCDQVSPQVQRVGQLLSGYYFFVNERKRSGDHRDKTTLWAQDRRKNARERWALSILTVVTFPPDHQMLVIPSLSQKIVRNMNHATFFLESPCIFSVVIVKLLQQSKNLSCFFDLDYF
jgi:hypothetical protein